MSYLVERNIPTPKYKIGEVVAIENCDGSVIQDRVIAATWNTDENCWRYEFNRDSCCFYSEYEIMPVD